MNYFDPSRPRICGRPAYVFDGKAIAPLPPLVITPISDDSLHRAHVYRIEFMLLREDRGGQWYERLCESWELGGLLAEWDNDPEAVISDLGWTFRYPRDQQEEFEEACLRGPGELTLSLDDIE